MESLKRLALMGLVIAIGSAPLAAQHARWDENEQVRDAVQEAGRRLSTSKCAKVFGEEAMAALMAANYRVLQMGKPRLQSNGRFTLLNAATIREDNLILLNMDGAFVNPRLQVNGRQFNLGLNELDFRALVILHELGHLIGRFGHDAGDPEQSHGYTDTIRRGCF